MNGASRPMIAAILLVLAGVSGVFLGVQAGMGAKLLSDAANDRGTGDVWGIVYESVESNGSVQKTALSGVNITIEGYEDDFVNRTDENGLFHFEKAPRGDRTLILQKDGYGRVEYTFVFFDTLEEPDNPSDALKETSAYGLNPNTDIQYLRIRMHKGDEPKDDEMRNFFRPEDAVTSYTTCTIFVIVCSIFTFLGVYFVWRQKKFAIAMLCAVCGVLANGPGLLLGGTCFSMIGVVVSVGAIFFVWTGRKEYDAPPGGRPQPADKGGGRWKDEEEEDGEEEWEKEYRRKLERKRRARKMAEDDDDEDAEADAEDEEEMRQVKRMTAASLAARKKGGRGPSKKGGSARKGGSSKKGGSAKKGGTAKKGPSSKKGGSSKKGKPPKKKLPLVK